MQDVDQVVGDTRRWLERAVVGLNLCPFAKAVLVKGQVHLAVSGATETADALAALEGEVDGLLALEAMERDTTLLVLPDGFAEFLDFHALVARGDQLLRRRRLEGVLQLASFHPEFTFAGAEPGDITNFTNRSPWPTLHLLREASIDRAVAAFPHAAAIYEANMETLRRLGPAGWQALGVGRTP